MKPLSFEKVLICFRLKSYFSATVSIPRTQHQIQMEMKSFMQNVCEFCSAQIAFCHYCFANVQLNKIIYYLMSFPLTEVGSRHRPPPRRDLTIVRNPVQISL